MIFFVLAAGLGANFIVFALLFRRLRNLSWQLRDMRAERNSEWILHALQDVPELHQHAALAADGTGFEPAHPQPVRRKRHLGLYLGGLGGIAATVAGTMREAWRAQRGQLAASAAAATLAASTAVVLIVIHQQPGSGQRPPSSAPTVTSTVTIATSPTASSAIPSATDPPPADVGPSAQPSASALPTTAVDASQTPIASEQPPAPPDASQSRGSAEPPPSGEKPPTSPRPETQTSIPPSACLGLAALPALHLAACLAGGG